MTDELLALRRCIGASAPTIRYRIDPGSARFFAESIMDPDPVFRYGEAGCANGYAPFLVPPTFFGGATGLLNAPAGDDRTMFGLVLPLRDGWSAIASGDEFEFLAPVKTDTVLTCHEQFEDAIEKVGRSGRLIFFTVVKTFSEADGHVVLRRKLHCVARPPRPATTGATEVPDRGEAAKTSHLPSITIGPVTIRYLAMFATATAEFVDIHYDADYARRIGLPGAIVQGLYKTSLAARMLKDWTRDCTALHWLKVQHRRMDLAGATLTAGGAIISSVPRSLPADVVCRVWVQNEDGYISTRGTAELTLPDTPEMAARLRDYANKEQIRR